MPDTPNASKYRVLVEYAVEAPSATEARDLGRHLASQIRSLNSTDGTRYDGRFNVVKVQRADG